MDQAAVRCWRKPSHLRLAYDEPQSVALPLSSLELSYVTYPLHQPASEIPTPSFLLVSALCSRKPRLLRTLRVTTSLPCREV